VATQDEQLKSQEPKHEAHLKSRGFVDFGKGRSTFCRSDRWVACRGEDDSRPGNRFKSRGSYTYRTREYKLPRGDWQLVTIFFVHGHEDTFEIHPTLSYQDVDAQKIDHMQWLETQGYPVVDFQVGTKRWLPTRGGGSYQSWANSFKGGGKGVVTHLRPAGWRLGDKPRKHSPLPVPILRSGGSTSECASYSGWYSQPPLSPEAEKRELACLEHGAESEDQTPEELKALADFFAAADDSPRGECTYLLTKLVGAYGLKFVTTDKYGTVGVVPMCNKDGVLCGIQYLNASPYDKIFYPGSRTSGNAHRIGSKRIKHDGSILLAEGYATAAFLYEVSGLPAVCCFSADNLIHVACILREKLPKVSIFVCGDNDRHLPEKGLENKGLVKAYKAADAVGGYVLLPDFGSAPAIETGSDWLDLAAFLQTQATQKWWDLASPSERLTEKAWTLRNPEIGRAKAREQLLGQLRQHLLEAGIMPLALG
jgi:phage/plasmid primase-like uncharacterized protein